jgi:hypothetical protein
MKTLSQHRRNCPISTWKNIAFRIRLTKTILEEKINPESKETEI